MPKRLRIYFRYDRDLLKELPKLAWKVVKEIYQAVRGPPPGDRKREFWRLDLTCTPKNAILSSTAEVKIPISYTCLGLHFV